MADDLVGTANVLILTGSIITVDYRNKLETTMTLLCGTGAFSLYIKEANKIGLRRMFSLSLLRGGDNVQGMDLPLGGHEPESANHSTRKASHESPPAGRWSQALLQALLRIRRIFARHPVRGGMENR